MTDLFGKSTDILSTKKLFFFDMDGTIYSENRLFDGSKELLDNIKKDGGNFIFITNNSSKSVENYIEKLKKMGIDTDSDNFYTSSQVAADFLKEEHSRDRIFCLGTKAFLKELEEAGLNVTDTFDENCNCLIVGFDTELTYAKLEFACKLLFKGVHYYATNIDKACPTDFGFIPDCGAICESIFFATNRKPRFLGKPDACLVNNKLAQFNIASEAAVVIGDRLYTDIACGVNAGVTTIGVLTGEMKMNDFNQKEKPEVCPDFLFENVQDLNEAIFEKKLI